MSCRRVHGYASGPGAVDKAAAAPLPPPPLPAGCRCGGGSCAPYAPGPGAGAGSFPHDFAVSYQPAGDVYYVYVGETPPEGQPGSISIYEVPNFQ